MMKIKIQTPRPAVFALLSLIAAYVLGGYAVARHYHEQDNFSFFLYSQSVFEVTVIIFLSFVFIRVWSIILLQRPRHLAKTVWADLHARIFSARKLNEAWPIYAGFIIFMSAFTSVKGLIPIVEPYHWDQTFMQMDRVLHGGVDPWRLLQPFMGYAAITPAVNFVYNMWFVVMFTVLYWQLFDLRQPARRMKFFWMFFLIWIINGSLLATLFSSAGPCYYDHLVQGINPFAEQMKYLRDLDKVTPVWAVGTQEDLWKSYKESSVGMGTGIAAMPSVHVSMATLFLLLAWPYGKWMRIFFVAFWIVIMAGSVHLAWHYAVDGYAGAFITLALWVIVGAVFKSASKGAATDPLLATIPESSE